MTRFLSTSFPTATETDAAYERPHLHIFYLFMLPGNIQSRPVSLHFNGVTLPLYDEAQVALRSRIEKNRLHSLRDIQECINRKQYWHFGQFTHYLSHIHNPTKLGTMYRKRNPSIRACGLHSAEHSSTVKLWLYQYSKSLTCKHQSMQYGFMFLFRIQQLLLERKHDLAKECK